MKLFGAFFLSACVIISSCSYQLCPKPVAVIDKSTWIDTKKDTTPLVDFIKTIRYKRYLIKIIPDKHIYIENKKMRIQIKEQFIITKIGSNRAIIINPEKEGDTFRNVKYDSLKRVCTKLTESPIFEKTILDSVLKKAGINDLIKSEYGNTVTLKPVYQTEQAIFIDSAVFTYAQDCYPFNKVFPKKAMKGKGRMINKFSLYLHSQNSNEEKNIRFVREISHYDFDTVAILANIRKYH